MTLGTFEYTSMFAVSEFFVVINLLQKFSFSIAFHVSFTNVLYKCEIYTFNPHDVHVGFIIIISYRYWTKPAGSHRWRDVISDIHIFWNLLQKAQGAEYDLETLFVVFIGSIKIWCIHRIITCKISYGH